uniref:Methyltransferase type 12 (CmoB) n=1 Tax=uncultured marine thaumarchaeote KM3_54_C03 TaxID=1456190 RepID=A0A075HDQ2_9ARCH|nr:methyltransferase type 12 (cmoB) [uncultured marine thaumarchaeote KM3_54_C03]
MMSQEQIKKKIIEYYRTILCREPDKDGIEYYVKMANNGASLDNIKELFLESSEYSILKSTKFLKHAPSFKTSFSDDEVQKMFDSVDGWYHYFKIGNVETTNTRTTMNYQMWVSQIIPTDLNGMKILDIGANDGFYSFLCESRGAKRILAIDRNQPELTDTYLKGENVCQYDTILKNKRQEERFQVLKKILNSKVDYKVMNVYNLDSINETFDTALFFGVYYHLENPVLAFQKIFPKINDSLFLSGHIIESKDPIMYLNDNKPHGGWFASSECLLQIGEKIGFKKCVLLDTLDMNFDIYSRTTDPDMKDLLNKSKIGLFKFSK